MDNFGRQTIVGTATENGDDSGEQRWRQIVQRRRGARVSVFYGELGWRTIVRTQPRTATAAENCDGGRLAREGKDF
ncbi:hypothetical protein TIFTF001_021666 [Ficus carica]|uniref:Uncharacterized protein n=1 Tax=Ficus carica TaxID=3494 RepID=A0AA88DJU7_FICCA|nr:hypothetical protein TIFTF001_021666 [Ficus carica]